MPIAGDQFTITLKETHLGWGNHRYTNTRDVIYNEGYVPIPREKAKKYNIYSKHQIGANTIYTFKTSDGFFTNKELKSSGGNEAGDIYAKNLHGNGNLKLLGQWYTHCKAKVGDEIQVVFTSPTSMTLTHKPIP